MKKTFLSTALLGALVALSGCEQSASITNLTAATFKVDGKEIYLRGEMNDYAILSSYKLVKEDDYKYCALAPLRADWAPYRFKFADPAWTNGANFGFAQAPGVLREGSSPVLLNRFSRFEELRYFPSEDGVYQLCISFDWDEYYAIVSKAQHAKLGLIDSIFVKQDEKTLENTEE